MSKHAAKPTPGESQPVRLVKDPEPVLAEMLNMNPVIPAPDAGTVMCDFHPDRPAVPGKAFCHDCFREYPKNY